MPFLPLALLVSLLAHLSLAHADTRSCPDLTQVRQVGACPTEEQLKHTFNGFCSDDAKAYKGETDVCTDYPRYRKMKNVALWESTDGQFDAYVSCELPQATLHKAPLSGLRVQSKGKLTHLVCSYSEGIQFIYRTRAQCTVDTSAACAAQATACQVTCN